MTRFGKCPKDSALVALFMNETSGRAADKLLLHLAGCSRCSGRYDVLRHVKRDLEPKVEAFTAVPDPAGRATGLKSAALRGLKSGPSLETSRSSSPGRPRPMAFLYSLRFAVAALILLAMVTTGAFVGLSRLRRYAVLRSPSVSLTLLSPSGEISNPPEVLRWTPVLNAEGYDLELIDDSLNRVYKSMMFLITEAVLPEAVRSALVRGRTYVWSVTARDGQGYLLASRSGSFTIK